MNARLEAQPARIVGATELRAKADELGQLISQIDADPDGRTVTSLLEAAGQWVQQNSKPVSRTVQQRLEAAWRRQTRTARSGAADDPAAFAAWLWVQHRCFVWITGDGTSALYALREQAQPPAWVVAVGQRIVGPRFCMTLPAGHTR